VGKYKDGAIHPIPGHSMPIATLGAFVLWLGWFGFNPGSTMAADVEAIARICITTNSAAAAGILSSTIISWMVLGKPDLSMTINGCLGGLVAITAGCAYVSVGSSVIIGLAAGTIVVFAVLAFDKLRIDDPVGALSVHLVNGIFGTIAVGLFAQDVFAPGTTGNGLFFGGGFGLLTSQLIGVAAVGAFTFGVSLVAWYALKVTVGIRVSREEEVEGLDVGEHGMSAYPEFASSPERYSAMSDETKPPKPKRRVEPGSEVAVEH
jgi:Amt family ammonium transporter